MILRVLLVVAALMIIGCTEVVVQKEEHLYPGAPTVSIKQASVEWQEPQILGYSDTIFEGRVVQVPIYGEGGQWGWVQVQYRLEAHEQLPYAIKVKLKIDGRSDTQHGWTGIIDSTRSHSIAEGRLVSGKRLNLAQFDRFDQGKDAPQGDEGERIKSNLRFQTVTISIEPWGGIGESPYNVGSPRSFTVKR